MTRQIINEGLDYHDLEGQVEPIVSVDEYAAKMGKNSEIVTVAFIVNSQAAGSDLVEWFERGYSWILDAQVSEGELRPGKYVVFVEMNRRSTVPEHIIELLDDLYTLTDIPLKDWTVKINDEDYDADEEVIKQVITISPHEYRENVDDDLNDQAIEDEAELNEMRERAGIQAKPIYADKQDAELRAFKSIAGL